MKYLCLVYSDEKLLHSLPDSPEDAECQAYADSVAESGRMLAAEALQPVASAATVRMRGGRMSVAGCRSARKVAAACPGLLCHSLSHFLPIPVPRRGDTP